MTQSASTGGSYAVRRLRDAGSVRTFVGSWEPDSCLVGDRLAAKGLGRHCRLWEALGSDGELAGLLLLDRIGFDRWVAHPLLADPGCAPSLAPVIDRSYALGIEGLARHVLPFVGHMQRASGDPVLLPFGTLDATDEFMAEHWLPLDDRVRLARPDELERVVEFYAPYEIQRVPTIPRLRRYLRGIMARMPVIIAEVDGRVVGGVRGEAMTERTIFWADLGVHPDYRGQGLSLALLKRMFVEGHQMGRTSAGVFGPRTTVEYREGQGYPDSRQPWAFYALRPWIRFRGHSTMRRIIESMEGRRSRWPVPPGPDVASAVTPGGLGS